MEKQINIYREETHELIAELEASLLDLEETPGDAELIDRVFRALHTIKGSGAMFGFENISDFTHHVETVFDLVRDGKVSVDKELIDLTLAASDQIKRMVDEKEVEFKKIDEIMESFQRLVPKPASQVKTAKRDVSRESCQDGQMVSYRIRFRPAPTILKFGANPILILDELRELGECHVVVQTQNVPDLENLEPQTCQMYWDIILTTACDVNVIQDVFIFVEDQCELIIDVIDESGNLEYEQDYKKLGQILLERGDVNTSELKKALGFQKRVGQLLVETRKVHPDAVESALAEQQHVKRLRQARTETSAASSIRIASEKLDRLVDLVGELVTVQARLSQKANVSQDADLLTIAEEVERLSDDLRENTMSIRMLPIGTTFSKFKRLVRDLSAELGKDVALVAKGGETELDKTVIERLGDPLVHIIRNSIDHGVEKPEQRARAGKPRQGVVTLSAEHSGAHVLITIADDGRGLDKHAIRAKAIEKGLLAPDVSITDSELFAFILEPGFTTAENVSDLSGRGVGMDVVKRGLDALRGSVEIKSAKGRGTEITLKLPLTLAIIDGLMVKIGADHYVMPLASVEECIELTAEDAHDDHGRNIVNLRGKIVPYLRLRELFLLDGEGPNIEMIVITEVNGDRVGFVVDHVLGEHQTVIKGIGRAYKNTRCISGATIMGDGSVALILDLPELVGLAELEARTY